MSHRPLRLLRIGAAVLAALLCVATLILVSPVALVARPAPVVPRQAAAVRGSVSGDRLSMPLRSPCQRLALRSALTSWSIERIL